MRLFLDTAALDEIHVAARWGVLDGVTTNKDWDSVRGPGHHAASVR